MIFVRLWWPRIFSAALVQRGRTVIVPASFSATYLALASAG